jgi:hypothetical protein
MSGKFGRVALFLVIAACLALGYGQTKVGAQGPAAAAGSPVPSAANGGALAAITVVYSQPASPAGGFYPSSWWDPNGSDYDQYIWDAFTIQATQPVTITEVRWRGTFDPTHAGHPGGPVIDFVVAIYASTANGMQPDVVSQPLMDYHTGGPAGQTPAGTFGGAAMYDYSFALPTPFVATPGVKYWLQVFAYQHGIPDWGIATGTGGDGTHFRKMPLVSDFRYDTVPGDAAFSLVGTGIPAATYKVYLPIVIR